MATSPEEYAAFQAQILNSAQHYRDVHKKEGDVSPIAECLIRLEGQEVTDFSSQYGSESTISYVACNLAGKTCVFPSYGDYTQACVFRTYGPWWKITPSKVKRYRGTPSSFTSEDFIEVTFAEYLYPVRIEVYETYNPGAIVRILACDRAGGSDTDKGNVTWVTLWSSTPKPCRQRPRIFAPHLKKIGFATNLIRLELCHWYMDYYTELDGIKLVGTKTPPCNEVHIHQPVLVVDDEDDDDPKEYDSENTKEQSSNDSKITNPVDELVDSIADLSLEKDDISFFICLPKEIIQLILSYLDLQDLCRLAQTCSVLRDHCYDPLLYTDLNLQPFWMHICSSSLLHLIPRCECVQRLNLSWLGKGGHILVEPLKHLLLSCGTELTTLELASCNFVDSSLMTMVVYSCSFLQELNLSSCRNIEDFSFFGTTLLQNLRRLNLYRTKIDTASMLSVIRSNPNLECLNIGSCVFLNQNINSVLKELGANCRLLKSLDIWRMKMTHDEGLSHLYNNCPLLEELDAGWCIDLKSESGCFMNLAKNCRNLKKLFLTANRTVRDSDLKALAKHCPLLEQLDILGTREVTKEAVVGVLEACKNLVLLDISFCVGITAADACSWRAAYPGRAIKKSFQNISIT